MIMYARWNVLFVAVALSLGVGRARSFSAVAATPPRRAEPQAASTTTTRDLLLWFPSVRSLLEVQELAVFADLTRDYVRVVGGGRMAELESLVVLGQDLQSIDKLPLANVILMEAGDQVLEAYLSKTMALSIQIRVEAAGRDTTDAVVPLLSNNWEAYVAFLSSGGLGQFGSSPVGSPSQSSVSKPQRRHQPGLSLDSGGAFGFDRCSGDCRSRSTQRATSTPQTSTLMMRAGNAYHDGQFSRRSSETSGEEEMVDSLDGEVGDAESSLGGLDDPEQQLRTEEEGGDLPPTSEDEHNASDAAKVILCVDYSR